MPKAVPERYSTYFDKSPAHDSESSLTNSGAESSVVTCRFIKKLDEILDDNSEKKEQFTVSYEGAITGTPEEASTQKVTYCYCH